MNGAIRIAADGSPSAWSRLASRLRGRREAAPVISVAEESEKASLVATFDTVAGLKKAKMQFSAAAFSSEEVVCICVETREHSVSPCARLYQSIVGSLLRARTQHHLPAGLGRAQARIREVLGSGGGLVIVRSCTKFGQACEIIQQCGGQIGL